VLHPGTYLSTSCHMFTWWYILWEGSPTLHQHDPQQNRLSQKPPLKHGVCTLQSWWSWPLSPLCWNGSTTVAYFTTTHASPNTTIQNNGNLSTSIPTLGRFSELYLSRHDPMSMDTRLVVVLHTMHNACLQHQDLPWCMDYPLALATQCIHHGSCSRPQPICQPTRKNKCLLDVFEGHNTCRNCRPYGDHYLTTHSQQSSARHSHGARCSYLATLPCNGTWSIPHWKPAGNYGARQFAISLPAPPRALACTIC